jgi:hypothetical protein
LLCRVPEGAPEHISTGQLASFLMEFYAACGQPSAPALLRMCKMLEQRQAVRLEPLFPLS